MLKVLSFLFIFSFNLFALSISSDDNYKVIESKNYNIVYTEDYKNEAKFIKYHLDDFLEQNNKSFGFSFDEPLRLVLISDNIQLPNAFSSQVPFNLGAYYNGGGGQNDYFASKSWLSMLLVHEMVHNYHMNAKKSKISKTLHKYLGNNFMPIFAGIVPLFTMPNIYLPTILKEGNAVLNESIYQNGGRLYHGSHNAMKNAIIFDDKLDKTRFINDHLDFPYTTEKYIVGGFYMEFLALKYGIDKVNQFFYEHSSHSINPFLLNKTYKKHFGISFDRSIEEFIKYTKDKYNGFNPLKSENILASSKSEIYLSKIDNKIYFITSDLKTKKALNIFDISADRFSSSKTSFKNGKLFKKGEKILVSSTDFIDSTLYKFGLFDEDNYIDEETIGKDIKDIFYEKIAYVDIKKSPISTKLYVGDEYYTDIASNAIFDNDGNIYYFKQEKETRILYKNETPLYEYKGYFGKLVEIKDKSIYFIANSKNGSTLYELKDKTIYKLSDADNIIDAKILNNNQALVVTITSQNYSVQKMELMSEVSSIDYEVVLDEKRDFKFDSNYSDEKLVSKKYNELEQLQFSLFYPSYSYNSDDGSSYYLTGLFMDPIMFNMLNIYAYKDTDKDFAGATYTNERYIPFSVDIYDMNRDKKYTKERGNGASIEIYGPLYKKGRHLVEVDLKYYLDDKNKDKNPTVLSLNHIYQKSFIHESDNYLKSDIEFLAKTDRGDKTFGGSIKYNKHLYEEFYFNLAGKYLKSDQNTLSDQRGIEVENDLIDTFQDKTTILMEGADNDFFVKDVLKFTFGLSKSFHLNKYFYDFPISLRNENIFYTHNRYDLTTTKDLTIKEDIYGITFDLLFVHNLSIPTTIKVIKNDASKDDSKFFISFEAGL